MAPRRDIVISGDTYPTDDQNSLNSTAQALSQHFSSLRVEWANPLPTGSTLAENFSSLQIDNTNRPNVLAAPSSIGNPPFSTYQLANTLFAIVKGPIYLANMSGYQTRLVHCTNPATFYNMVRKQCKGEAHMPKIITCRISGHDPFQMEEDSVEDFKRMLWCIWNVEYWKWADQPTCGVTITIDSPWEDE